MLCFVCIFVCCCFYYFSQHGIKNEILSLLIFDHAAMMYFLAFNPNREKLCVNTGSRNGSVPNIAEVRIMCHHTIIIIVMYVIDQLTKRYFHYAYEHSSK